MKHFVLLVLAAILLCSCHNTTPETEPEQNQPAPEETISATVPETTPDTTEETEKQIYDPEAAGEIPPWETALREEEFTHTWNPSPTMTEQSFQILRFGEKYRTEQDTEAIREDDWIVETRKCYVRMKMPSHWYWDGVYGTEEKGYTGKDSLRLSYEKVLYRQSEIPAHWTLCTVDADTSYYHWITETGGITLYHFAYPVRVALVDYFWEAVFYGHPDTIAEPTPEEYYDTYIKPMAESVQIETSGGGIPFETGEMAVRTHTMTFVCADYLDVVFMNQTPNEDCAFTCNITMDLPVRWELTEKGQVHDTVRQEAGCLRDIRMEIWENLYHVDLTAGTIPEDYVEQTTPNGRKYYVYDMPYEANNPYTAVQNGQYLIPTEDESHYLILNLFIYPTESDAPDVENYRETVLYPILDSIQFEIVE